MTVVVHLRSWSRGGFCEDHWLPIDRFYETVRALLDSGHTVVEVGRS